MDETIVIVLNKQNQLMINLNFISNRLLFILQLKAAFFKL